MKKLLRRLLFSILVFIGLIGLYLLVEFCMARVSIEREPINQVTGGVPVDIYILTNGVHTDIVVPVKSGQIDWSKDFRFENTNSKDSTKSLLAIGWGDRGFYLETPTWADLKVSTALNAAFGLGNSAVHATFYRSLAENNFCRKITISAEQYSRLAEYIMNTLKKGSDGHAIVIATNANYNNADAFYEANKSYSMFRTCNTWANNALAACGQTHCLWTAFDTGIFLKYPPGHKPL